MSGTRFSCELAERLNEVALNGFEDDNIGTTDALGWFGRFNKERAILTENDQGFVSVHVYNTDDELSVAWDGIEAMYTEYCAHENDE